jgi:hypothetical protein
MSCIYYDSNTYDTNYVLTISALSEYLHYD